MFEFNVQLRWTDGLVQNLDVISFRRGDPSEKEPSRRFDELVLAGELVIVTLYRVPEEDRVWQGKFTVNKCVVTVNYL